ncbi:hypothetical protein GQ54DRAFT_264923 [Martensiomyces pterosporus]|nr:hypothetical protein GQ54DRAFT_264923 [Martensiomyces pterosporus]
MVHRSRSILPKWYAEDKFLLCESMRTLADVTENFIFARLFLTPSNRDHHDGNHLHMDFCNLEFPWDCNGVLADPPENIPELTVQTYQAQGLVPRCTIDTTLKDDAKVVVDRFVQRGFECERDMQDTVMLLSVGDPCVFAKSGKVRRITDRRDVGRLTTCNARAFGYDKSGDTEWLDEKLRRQVERPDEFAVWVLEEQDEVAAFAVMFTPRKKARNLAFVQVVGTDPQHRRRGLAQEVVVHALAHLAQGTRVYLEAFEEGPIELYRKIGFETVGTTVTTECWLPN